MKKIWLLIFLSVTSVSAAASTYNDVISPYFSFLEPSDPRDSQILYARKQAVDLIRAYKEKYVSYFRDNQDELLIIDTMIIGPKRSPITKRNDLAGNNTDCESRAPEKGGLAYVPFEPIFKQVFRLCKPVALKFDIYQLTQMFVHESFHMGEGLLNRYIDPISSEVGAVMYETEIMSAVAGGCSYVYPGYFDIPVYARALKDRGVRKLKMCNGYRTSNERY